VYGRIKKRKEKRGSSNSELNKVMTENENSYNDFQKNINNLKEKVENFLT